MNHRECRCENCKAEQRHNDYFISSISGAILGNLAFGIIGAVFGAIVAFLYVYHLEKRLEGKR